MPSRRSMVRCPQLILGHKPLSRARVGCAGAIATAYRDAYGSVGRYEELRAINDFCASYDAVAYQMAERDVTQYRRDMVMIKWEGGAVRVGGFHPSHASPPPLESGR